MRNRKFPGKESVLDRRFALWTIGVFLVSTMLLGNGARSQSRATGETNRPDLAATVNDKPIMMSDLERVLRQQLGKNELTPAELDAQRLQTLESLIDRELLFQRAEREHLLPMEKDVLAAINKQKQEAGMTEEQFNKELRDQNLTIEQVREDTRKDLAIQALQDNYANKINISDREVEEYYHKHQQDFFEHRGVSLSMIMVDPADNSAERITDDAKGVAQAKVKIDNLYGQLKAGADFATLAKTKSEDANSSIRGGDIGFATEDDLNQNGFPKSLIAQLFALTNGSYTAPVSFPSGRWYIFKVNGRVLEPRQLTLDSPGTRQEIAKVLLSQRKETLNSALLTITRNEAKIVNYLAARKIANP